MNGKFNCKADCLKAIDRMATSLLMAIYLMNGLNHAKDFSCWIATLDKRTSAVKKALKDDKIYSISDTLFSDYKNTIERNLSIIEGIKIPAALESYSKFLRTSYNLIKEC